ncbi:hypothetical protein BGZ60DRAFT_429997 [Tricladium varicosporioides]|nr:hypothetical protein BGZ60DRAFT_429997 [Hymenoscyphus varicosporioides]
MNRDTDAFVQQIRQNTTGPGFVQQGQVLDPADLHLYPEIYTANLPERFAQNLRQGVPICNAPPPPRPINMSNMPLSDQSDQLENSMLMPPHTFQKFQVRNEPPSTNHYQQPQGRTANPLQPQKQQITPPFNLSGFSGIPNALQNAGSSPSYGQGSSPTTRISLRKAANRPLPSTQCISTQASGQYIEPPRTPQHQTASSARNPVQTPTLDHAPPIAHGIQLVSPHELPDRFCQVFPYQLFNAVQSKCFTPIYKSNDNIVISAPTGGGKTALLELAICRAVETNICGQFKIVYQAPTKSLCSERVRDWSKKFSHLNLQCAELTGDTSQSEMARVRGASIIITTPEKWDSITRKWTDHHKLVQMVKLFLIDEVHILKEARGATLEAVVSRMKSMGANVRFVALSATVPNSEDIAVWLGRDHTNQHLPAHRETFGESFRPVKLQKHVYGFDGGYMNDFAFEKVLDGKLCNLIQRHTHKKPIMVFCFTRKSCEATATMLAEWWLRQKPADRAWPCPKQRIGTGTKELQELVACGVAFHHAGLDLLDRQIIENAYLKGDINLICCTSTLAVGVNLPCHLVVLKGTVGFQDSMPKEYSDLEVMQMLGRAGRPQFDDSAAAVIMTKSDNKQRYERMISGQDVLESTLHLNLIEHLNSEIGLRTVSSLEKAKNWLAGTFLAVRMRQNPNHYSKIEGINPGGNPDERLMLVCERDVNLLQETNLVSSEQQGLKCTKYGEAMSRYMVSFTTMKQLLKIPKDAKTEEILNCLCEASEFKDLRMKPKERPCLREFNKSPFIKFPIKENVSNTAHKVSMLLQAQLGGVEHPIEKGFGGLKRQFNTEKAIIFDRVQRLIRCVVDCKIADGDSISVRHALDLARSLSAGFWEYSNLQIQQVPQVGPVAVRKFVDANINSIEKLSQLDYATIERIVSRNPPFGRNLQQILKGFPHLTLFSEIVSRVPPKSGQKPKVSVRAVLGFSNEKVPIWKGMKPSLTFTAETTDGVLAYFWRGNVQKLEKGYELKFTVDLTNPGDGIKCHIACDHIVGTVQSSVLKPEIPTLEFPRLPEDRDARKPKPSYAIRVPSGVSDDFGDDIDDYEMLEAVQGIDKGGDPHSSEGFADVDDYLNRKSVDPQNEQEEKKAKSSSSEIIESFLMVNGKWTCFHSCRDNQPLKNGQLCKHRCCHEGLDKRPKPRPKANISSGAQRASANQLKKKEGKSAKNSSQIRQHSPNTMTSNPRMTQRNKVSLETVLIGSLLITDGVKGLGLKLKKRGSQEADLEDLEVIDLAQEHPPFPYEDSTPRGYRNLHRLHNSVQGNKVIRLPNSKPKFQYASSKPAILPFSSHPEAGDSLDFSLSDDEELPPSSALVHYHSKSPDPFKEGGVTFGNERIPISSFENDPLETLPAGMLDPSDSMMQKPSTPNVDSSFARKMFDFEAFDDHGNLENSNMDLILLDELIQEKLVVFPAQASRKRDPSLSFDTPEVEVRRVKKERLSLEVEPAFSTPSWVDELDPELMEDLKGFVEFVG